MRRFGQQLLAEIRVSEYSVVIPALNAARYIDRAIASVQGQTLRPVEIIVVDDGSTDSTASIARSLGASVIQFPVSGGPSRARNSGVRESKSPMIAFLDADDEWLPDHAALILNAMSNGDAAFAAAQAEWFGMLDGPVPNTFEAGRPIDVRDTLVMGNPITQSGVILSRVAFEAAGGYDESLRLSEDYDLWLRMAEQGRFVFVEQTTLRRRIHDDQLSMRFTPGMVRSAWDVRRRAVARRLCAATESERAHVFRLLAEAARRDLAWAIWTGDAQILGVVREEFTRTDDALDLPSRIDAIGGSGRPLRRVSQNLKRATYGAWSLLQRGGIAR